MTKHTNRKHEHPLQNHSASENSIPRVGFRKNVAALIEVDGLFLACERADLPGSWQCVQGGVDEGDLSLEAALARELREELGVPFEAFALVRKSSYWRRYRFPENLPPRVGKNHLGQDQVWFHVRLDSLKSIHLEASDGEFRSVSAISLSELVGSFVAWKRALLRDFCNELGLG